MSDSLETGEFGILLNYDRFTAIPNPICLHKKISISNLHTTSKSPLMRFRSRQMTIPLRRKHLVMIAQPEHDLLGDIHTLGFIPVPEEGPKLWWLKARHMAMETGYGIRKLRLIHARTSDLVSLRQWGSCLKRQWCRAFEGKYDNLLGLLKIKVQLEALSALTQYYNSPLRCFTFRDFQLAPTLGEYKRILGMPLASSLPYLFKR
ncbi:hypothetical protein CR513_20092, partial [Mucuna pruriens]